MLLKWLGHASFKIKTNDNKVIYIDPYAGEESNYKDLADIVLVSHFHYDHCSLEKIRRIQTESTVIAGTREVAAELHGCTVLIPGQPLLIEKIKITAVPAYNIRKGFHQKGFSVGFLIEVENKTIYFVSDSDLISEMTSIKADIMLVPVGGTFTMKPREAVQVVRFVKPKIAIPMHYGYLEGTQDDAELFMELAQSEDTEIVILSQGEEVEA